MYFEVPPPEALLEPARESWPYLLLRARQPGSGYPKQIERGLISPEKQGMLILAVGSPHWYWRWFGEAVKPVFFRRPE